MNMISWFYTLRSYIDTYLGFLKGSRFWSLIWVFAICVLIWFYGEAVAFGSWRPLESEFRRLVAIGIIVLAWFVYLLVSYFNRRNAEKSLIDDLTGEPIDDPEATAQDDISQIQTRLKDALLKMRSITKKRFNYVYDFPWYMIIGSPGSGKTTALLNSGLTFPLGEDVEGLQGVGGTRSCDWWFTDDAILIDTAGRYTTHDSDVHVDSSGWQGFLGMLKKHRPLKPVNGIIITISLEDALTKSPQSRIKEIRTIRQRLRDLEETLKIRLPVYLMFTKVDMVAGFSEFFDSFNKFDREQVLGSTFPIGVSQSRGKISDAFSSQYDLILERLNRLLIERMQQEPDDIRRGKVYNFPAQFAALKKSILEMVSELTLDSKLNRSPLLRGVYFVSATQSGQVYDKMRVAVSERFAFLPDADSSGKPSEKSYFLSRLFNEVIFGEANLVTTDSKVLRRKRILTGILYFFPILIAGGLFSVWVDAWFTNKNTIQAVNEKIALYNRDAVSIVAQDVSSEDIARVVEPLDALRSAIKDDVPGTDKWFHVGIEQEQKIQVGLQNSYNRGLNGLLLPRLLVYLQNGIDQNGIAAGDIYSRLKLYLMLGGEGRMDREYVIETIAADFQKRLVNQPSQVKRRLIVHIKALIENPNIRIIPLNRDLIDRARSALKAKQPSERIYEIMLTSPKVLDLTPWRPSDKAGTGSSVLLGRKSGKSLQDGISGAFTRQGFYSAVLPEINTLTKEFLSEPWVLGDDYIAGFNENDVKRDILRQYVQAYSSSWSGLMRDINILEVRDLQQATNIVGVMTTKDNPLKGLLKAVSEDSNLLPEANDPPDVGESTTEAIDTPAPPILSPNDVFLINSIGQNTLDPYSKIREYITSVGDQPSSFDNLGDVFEELFRQVSRAATNTGAVNNIFGVESALATANQRLVTEAQRIPAPADLWLGTLATDIARLSATGARRSISDLWQTTGGRFCSTAIEGRYPFVANATNDVAINDFVRMFGPSGEFSNFFDLHLKPFVDVSQSPWKWKALSGNETVTNSALKQFEIANKIQAAFFSNGSALSVTLDITPVELDNDSTAVLLSINDQSVGYDHGPVRTKSLQWPGEGNRSARVTFQPPGPNTTVSSAGPWAAFRLFDRAQREVITKDKFQITFKLAKRQAAFDIQVGSVINPFSLPELSEFNCPTRL